MIDDDMGMFQIAKRDGGWRVLQFHNSNMSAMSRHFIMEEHMASLMDNIGSIYQGTFQIDHGHQKRMKVIVDRIYILDIFTTLNNRNVGIKYGLYHI
jgi:hypothetical protein